MPQQNNIYTVKELNERIQELVSGEPWLGSLGVELSLIHISEPTRP